MIRTIGSVVIGYLAISVMGALLLLAAYLVIGVDGAYQPNSYDVTPLWLAASFTLALAAAVAGGWICAAIARNPKAVLALAGLVFVLGLLMAVPALTASNASEAKTRGPGVGAFEAMQNSKQPAWTALLNPFLGVAGVILGGRLKKYEKSAMKK